MKNLPFAGAALLALTAAPTWAQGPVSGTLTDGRGAALPGAILTVPDVPGLGAITDAAGRFTLPAVPATPHTLRAIYAGFEAVAQPLQGQPGPQQLPVLALQTARNLTPEAVVTATRANARTGTTYQNVSREQLQARNFGQEFPTCSTRCRASSRPSTQALA